MAAGVPLSATLRAKFCPMTASPTRPTSDWPLPLPFPSALATPPAVLATWAIPGRVLVHPPAAAGARVLSLAGVPLALAPPEGRSHAWDLPEATRGAALPRKHPGRSTFMPMPIDAAAMASLQLQNHALFPKRVEIAH